MTNPQTPVVFIGPDGAKYVSYQTEIKVQGYAGISEPVMLVKLVPLDSLE